MISLPTTEHLQAMRKDYETLEAAADPFWNWRGFRPPLDNPIHEFENPLPPVVRDFMRNINAITGGTHIIYGGALIPGKAPKDFDGYVLSPLHPLQAMQTIETWAGQNGYTVEHYRDRVRLLWKRLKIRTAHGEYDLGCYHGKMDALSFAHLLADEADVGICARSATADTAYQSQRFVDSIAQDKLIFRPFERNRDRFRHFDRWLKYAIVKYPQHAIEYQDPEDAALFTELNARRAEFAAHCAHLRVVGLKPQNFEPLRPLIPELYDRLHELARSQLTG